MNERAILGNHEFRLIEVIPALEEKGRFVLCSDKDGMRYICSEEFWMRQAPQSVQAAAIDTNSSDQEKIELFLSLFRGREDAYARRYYSLKTGKSGYVPACKNEWEPNLCDKKAYRCPDCPNRAFVPLTAQIVKAHLIDKDIYCRDVVGLYPMLEDNHTQLLVADFDEASWREDVSAFRETCISFGLVPAVERSRSGDGAHIWFFFSQPVSAADARRLGSGLLTQTMARRHELRFQSYDRLFPSQDTVPKGGFGNLIALPNGTVICPSKLHKIAEKSTEKKCRMGNNVVITSLKKHDNNSMAVLSAMYMCCYLVGNSYPSFVFTSFSRKC